MFKLRGEAMLRMGISILMLVAGTSIGSAQQILKQEPMPGQLPSGSVVLVDDGTRGKGKIKEITGGDNSKLNPKPRVTKCIAKK
jgi:hypothetical protein